MSTGYKRDTQSKNQMLMPWGVAETISAVDAAAMCQCSVDVIYDLIDEGRIKAYRITPHKKHSPWRVNRASVERYIQKLREQSFV